MSFLNDSSIVGGGGGSLDSSIGGDAPGLQSVDRITLADFQAFIQFIKQK